MDKLSALRNQLATILDLEAAAAILSWDQHTYMPRGGLEARVRQITTLQALIHERMASNQLHDLLGELEAEISTLDPLDARLVQVTRRDVDQARRLPASLVTRKAEATGRALDSWMENRPRGDFGAWRPHLEEVFAIVREEAEALGYEEEPYDALLQRYEPGMGTRQLRRVFNELREGLVDFRQQVLSVSHRVDDQVLRQHFDAQKQWDLGMRMLGEMGFDFSHGRQDRSPHPFTTSFGLPDVRVTTRIHEDDLRAGLFGTLHEGGHGLYEQNFHPAFDRTTLAQGSSLGIHESQSRLWENLVGRSRPFWNRWFGEVKALFPAQLDAVTFQSFYAAINCVRPSLIRVEADELSYNLHIFVRFELELQLLAGDLAVADLPGAWDELMASTLGIRPPSPKDGCMQDMHWADASVGYFPTYALGNLYGVQFFNRARRELPDLDEAIASGRLQPLKQWLSERIYRPARAVDPGELLMQVTGELLSPQPWLAYVREKYSELYGLD